jgi:WD40 repeat protein
VTLDKMDALSFAPSGTALAFGGGYGGRFGTAGPASRALVVSLDGGPAIELRPRDSEDPWAPHRMNLFAVRFSPDGNRVVTAGGRDRTVKIWDATTGELLLSCRRPDNIYPVRSIDVAPDGTKIASSWGDGVIAIFDAASGELAHSFVAHDGNAPKVAFTPDGESLVSCSWDQTVKIWDATSGQRRANSARPSRDMKIVLTMSRFPRTETILRHCVGRSAGQHSPLGLSSRRRMTGWRWPRPTIKM